MQHKINRILIYIALSFVIILAVQADDLKSQDIYKQSLPSIMTLKVLKNNGDNVLGSGFMAIKDGIAVTAWHVVRDAKSVTAKFSDGQEFEASGLVDKDEKRDIAIIHVKVFGKKLLTLATTAPDIGSTAYVIGAPEGLEFSITNGLLSQIQVAEGINHYQFSCPASPGNSGGPLFNAQGQVIGVVSFQFREGQNLNFAVPSTYVLGLDSTLPTQPWGSVKELVMTTSVSGVQTDADLDKILARTLLTYMDIPTIMEFTAQDVVRKKDGYKAGVPAIVYQLQQEAKDELDALNKATTGDATRQHLITGFQSILTHQLQAADLLIAGIHNAQAYNGWTPLADDTILRSSAAENSIVPISFDESKPIINSIAFASLVSPDEIENLRHGRDDGTGYHLNCTDLARNSLNLMVVAKDGLADKLGLKDGDQLISSGNKNFTSLVDFKHFVKENVGHEIRVNVFRERKQQEIKMKVPDQLPK